MTLDNLINKKKNIYNKQGIYPASLTLLVGRALDNLSTYLCIDKFGTEVEANPVVRGALEQFGNSGGLMLSEIFGLSLIGGATYLLNKWTEKDEGIIKNSGSKMLYGVGLLSVPVAINNFMVYF